MSRSRIPLAASVAVLAAAALAVPAAAANYPPPSKPGAVQGKPKGPHRTLLVCEKKRGHGCYPRIQDAVDAAKAGDTIRVPHGTWHEAVLVRKAAKRYISLIGDVKHPGKVVLDGDGKRQNGVLVDGANNVTVRGFSARDYRANGFFVVNVTGYTLRDLIATHVGTYGIYAFNSIGGLMADDTASQNNDGGFYIGQTPVQAKPVRTIARNLTSFENVLGWSGTNMRYVTISKSSFYNNGLGIVPNALDSEKFAPAEDNVITDNDVFWNNFNYYRGAPFMVRPGATGELAYPPGLGVLLYGGHRNQVTGNRIFGNYLGGAAMVEAVTLQQADAKDLMGNQITNNAFGKGGADLNGRDILYDGNGAGNCVSGNTGLQVTVPADQSTFAACPFSAANTYNADAFNEMVAPAGDSTHEQFWIKHPHQPIAGITPLEHYSKP
jgi:hypothetical protein